MDRNILIGVLGFTVLALFIGIVAPALFAERQPLAQLPWQVELAEDGATRVFGLTLERSTLADAERELRKEAEINLFQMASEAYVIEAYFDPVNLGGLSAKVVMTVDIPRDEQREMFGRGLRISTLGSGTRKVTLAPEDLARVRGAAIDTITYLPGVNLSDERVAQRFGTPARRLREADTGVAHWLYPDRGIDVALSDTDKDVIQYVHPARFERLVAPLVDSAEAIGD